MKLIPYLILLAVSHQSCNHDDESQRDHTNSPAPNNSNSSEVLSLAVGTGSSQQSYWRASEQSRLFDKDCPSGNASYHASAYTSAVMLMQYASTQDSCVQMLESMHRPNRLHQEKTCQSLGGSFVWTENYKWNDACMNHSEPPSNPSWSGGLLSFGTCCGAKRPKIENDKQTLCEKMGYAKPMKTIFSQTAFGKGRSNTSCEDAKDVAKADSDSKLSEMRRECLLGNRKNTWHLSSSPDMNPDGCWSVNKDYSGPASSFASIFLQQGICCGELESTTTDSPIATPTLPSTPNFTPPTQTSGPSQHSAPTN